MNPIETVVIDELRCDRPITQDIFAIYRVRYTRVQELRDDGLLHKEFVRQEYGGFHDQWREYEAMEAFDYTFEGVILFDGIDYLNIRSSCAENMLRVRRDHSEIREIRDTLDRWLSERK